MIVLVFLWMYMSTFAVLEKPLVGFGTQPFRTWTDAYFDMQRSLIDAGFLLEMGSIEVGSDSTLLSAYIQAKSSPKDAFVNF